MEENNNKPKKRIKGYAKKTVTVVLIGSLLAATAVTTVTNVVENHKIEATTDELMENDYLDIAKAILAERYNEVYGQNVSIDDIDIDIKDGYSYNFKLERAHMGSFKFIRKMILNDSKSFDREGSGSVLVININTPDGKITIQEAEKDGNPYCVFGEGVPVDQSQSKLLDLYDLILSLKKASKSQTIFEKTRLTRRVKKLLKKSINKQRINSYKIEKKIEDKKDSNYELQSFKKNLRVTSASQFSTMEGYIKNTMGLDVSIEETGEVQDL